MTGVRSLNLLLRFVLELCALGALGYWGAKAGDGLVLSALLAVCAPLVAATAWGLFASPRARYDVQPAGRLLVELIVFGAATAGLLAEDHPGWALTLAAAYVANRSLMALLGQRAGPPAE